MNLVRLTRLNRRRALAARERQQRHALTGLVVAALIICAGGQSQAGHSNDLLVLDPEYIKAQYDKGRKLTAIDIRSSDDFRQGHLPGARSIPLADLPARFHDIPTSGLVVLYCDCEANEIAGVYRFLQRQSYRNLSMLREGFRAWNSRGYPIER